MAEVNMDADIRQTNVFPNELYQEIFGYLELLELKILRLVNKKSYINATEVFRKKYQPRVQILRNYAPNDNRSIESFIRFVSSSTNCPFQKFRLHIAYWNYDEETVHHFLDKYGDRVSECNFSFCSNDKPTMELLCKVNNILQKTVCVKRINMRDMRNSSGKEDLKIVLPSSVETLGLTSEMRKRDSNHVCVGNGNVCVSSYFVFNSLPTLKIDFSCNDCLVHMLQETVLKGLKEIIVENPLYVTLPNSRCSEKILEIRNPSPTFSNIVMYALPYTVPCFRSDMESMFTTNQNHLKDLAIHVLIPTIDCFPLVVPNLPRLTKLCLEVYRPENVKFCLNAQYLKTLSVLILHLRQESDFCLISTVGTFALNKLDVDSSMLCYVSSEEWAASFSTIQYLKILVKRRSGQTSVPENFKISRKFKNVVNLNIHFDFDDDEDPFLDETLEFQRWTGGNLALFMSQNQGTRSEIGLCQIPELAELTISNLSIRTFKLWIKMLIQLTITKQLKSLDRIVLCIRPHGTLSSHDHVLVTKQELNLLVSYHRLVDIYTHDSGKLRCSKYYSNHGGASEASD